MRSSPGARKVLQHFGASSAQRHESEAVERARIKKVMGKWLRLDEPAKQLGRGLGRRTILERVARDVGTSIRNVQRALA